MPCVNKNNITNAIVYSHSKLNGEIFYIGISNNIYRPYSKVNRTKYWHNIINKHSYKVDILCNGISYNEAISIEKYLILFYGRKDLKTGNLVNMTIGGEGVVGNIVSEETKLKMSISRKGTIWSNQHRINHKISRQIVSKETRDKISKNNAKTKSKKVIDTFTNKIYLSLIDACKNLQLNYNTTKAKLRGQNPNNTNLKYI